MCMSFFFIILLLDWHENITLLICVYLLTYMQFTQIHTRYIFIFKLPKLLKLSAFSACQLKTKTPSIYSTRKRFNNKKKRTKKRKIDCCNSQKQLIKHPWLYLMLYEEVIPADIGWVHSWYTLNNSAVRYLADIDG